MTNQPYGETPQEIVDFARGPIRLSSTPSAHPKIGIQPACADRLTVSRRRIQHLIEKAAARADEEAVPRWAAYAAGVADVLTYLLDADQLDFLLAEILEV